MLTSLSTEELIPADHPTRKLRAVVDVVLGEEDDRPSLEELLVGPTADPSGQRNLFGAVRRVMGKCGYSTVKEFQKAELIVTAGR
jgi:IMP dehydrogenase